MTQNNRTIMLYLYYAKQKEGSSLSGCNWKMNYEMNSKG